MTGDRLADDWDRIGALLEASLARAPAERAAFLRRECADDAALYGEVESLIAAYERGSMLDSLAGQLPALGALLPHSPDACAVGDTVGNYRVVARLAGGGMGVVYEAFDERLGRTVALKFLHPALITDATAAERFRREARMIAAIEHPNVCVVHEFGETADGQLYLVMPRYDGETLQDRLIRGPLAVDDAVSIARQIARGLGKAHSLGIVHRDIKPSNVFVTGDGVVKILDFGIAKLADATNVVPRTTSVRPRGTVAYASPEQLRGEALDPRTDLWSLGVVLYEMLAGVRPFGRGAPGAIMARIAHDQPTAPSAMCGGVPATLDTIVAQALSKSREMRQASAAEFERQLAALGVGSAEHDAGGATTSPATAPSEVIRRRPAVIAAAAVIALIIVTVILLVRASPARF